MRPTSGSAIGVSRGSFANLLISGEEIVGAVDFVHLAGARVADHHGRPVDAIPQPRRRAHQQLGFELRLVIGRRQLLADVEIGFGEVAAESSGHRDRGHVMQRRVQPAGKGDHRAGAVDVGGPVLGLAGGQIVDSRAVHQVVDGPEIGQGRRR